MEEMSKIIEIDGCPERAVTPPPVSTANHQDSFDSHSDRIGAVKCPGSLTFSDGVNDSIKEELSRHGQKLDVEWSPIGSPGMLYIDQDTGHCTLQVIRKRFRTRRNRAGTVEKNINPMRTFEGRWPLRYHR